MVERVIAFIFLIIGLIVGWNSKSKIGFNIGLTMVWLFGSYLFL